MPTQPQDGEDRRTQLAADHTVFAAERTYAAWVPDRPSWLASGIGAKRLLEGMIPEWGIDHHQERRRDVQRLLFRRGECLLVLVALNALISIWFGRTGGD